MLFRRRHKPSALTKLRAWIWPRSGWRRAGLYVWHRLARLPGTPHSIAAGFACGAAISFTPFLGFHIALALAFATILRGNYLAAVIGTVVGNPWTFPPIFALTAYVGMRMLGHDAVAEAPVWDWNAIFVAPVTYLSEFVPLVYPLIIGGIPVAVIVWVVFYLVFKDLLTRYRARRAARVKTSGDSADEPT